jgi:hypothetical protein
VSEAQAALLGVALPFAVGAVTAGLASKGGRGRWVGALVIALGYLPLHAVLIGWPHGGGYVRAETWLGWLVPIAAAVGVFGSPRPTLALVQRAAVVAALLVALCHPLLRGVWRSVPEAVMWLVGLGVPLGLFARGAERNASVHGPGLAFGLVALTAIAAALVTVLAGSALYAQLLGAVGAAAGGVAAVGLFLEVAGRRPPLAASSGPVVTVTIGGLLVAGVLFVPVRWDEALLVALPLVIVGFLRPAPPRPDAEGGWRGVGREILRLGALAMPLAAAASLAAWRYESSPY